ncbi:MAG: hypothetical protein N3A71_00520 [Candidatus Dojkabacteria bacterium]|nr:hypothetical protein [Candidatus Dojkabacteria bacterium]
MNINSVLKKIDAKYVFYILISLFFFFFNPYINPNIYFDSLSYFGSLTFSKVLILSIINLSLLAYWFYKIYKEKEIRFIFTSHNIFIILLGLLSIFSIFYSPFYLNNMFGNFYTIDNSFIECINLIIFAFLSLNIIENRSNFFPLLRAIYIGISLSGSYLIIRLSTEFIISNPSLSNFVNNVNFYPSGDLRSAAFVFFIAICLGYINIIRILNSELSIRKNQIILIIDLLATLVNILSFFLVTKIISLPIPIFETSLIVAFIVFMYSTARTSIKFKSIIFHLIVIIPWLVGIISYIILAQLGILLPSVRTQSIDLSWRVILSKYSQSNINSILLGNGFGSYMYTFDIYKPSGLQNPANINGQIQTPLTINAQAPSVYELRAIHASTFVLQIIHDLGVMGILLIILIFLWPIFRMIQNGIYNYDFTTVFLGTTNAFIFFFMLLYRLDTTALMLAFFTNILLVSFMNIENPASKILLFAKGRFSKPIVGFNYVVPIIILIVISFTIYSLLPIGIGNYYINAAKKYLIEYSRSSNDEKLFSQYTNNVLNAISWQPYNDIYLREFSTAQLNILTNKVNELIVNKRVDSNYQISEEDQNFINSTINNNITLLNRAIANNPYEYKNHYLMGYYYYEIGRLQNTFSDGQNMNFDAYNTALTYFQNVLTLYNRHPDTLFRIGRIFLDTANPNQASPYIQEAIIYLPILDEYNEGLADLYKLTNQCTEALKIYNLFKESKDKLANRDLYMIWDIDNDIKFCEENNSKEKNQTEVNNP